MKKLMVVSLLLAGILSTGVIGIAQAQTSDLKPTFISFTPGIYVNAWPPFTVTYPKEWEEQRPVAPWMVFLAGKSAAATPAILVISASFNPADVNTLAGMVMAAFSQGFKDVKLVSDKPSKLQDGTPAQEVEVEYVSPNGTKVHTFFVGTKKDDIFITVSLDDWSGKVGEDLKSIAHSLNVSQGKPEPVKVPPDVQALLDSHGRALQAGDVAKIMANYSDRYLNNGTKKSNEEQWYRYHPWSPLNIGAIKGEMTATVFESQGDRAYLGGFVTATLKNGSQITSPWTLQRLIKEDGQWKWYGNQK
jgi:hypothetical protein